MKSDTYCIALHPKALTSFLCLSPHLGKDVVTCRVCCCWNFVVMLLLPPAAQMCVLEPSEQNRNEECLDTYHTRNELRLQRFDSVSPEASLYSNVSGITTTSGGGGVGGCSNTTSAAAAAVPGESFFCRYSVPLFRRFIQTLHNLSHTCDIYFCTSHIGTTQRTGGNDAHANVHSNVSYGDVLVFYLLSLIFCRILKHPLVSPSLLQS